MSPVTHFDPPAYPSLMLHGDVVAAAFRAVQQRLRAIYPEEAFQHSLLPPSPTRRTWEELLRTGPTVALSLASWKRNNNVGATFRGALTLPLAVVLTHTRPEHLYLGTDQVRGMGIAGVMAAAVGAFHGWHADGVGTCSVHQSSLVQTDDWFNDRAAVVAIDLVFDDLALDNSDSLDQLDRYLRHPASIDLHGETP